MEEAQQSSAGPAPPPTLVLKPEDFDSAFGRQPAVIERTEWRAMTLSQLRQLKQFLQKHAERSALEVLNLYHVNQLIIMPATEKERVGREHGCSFVELLATVGTKAQNPTWFVSHWWGEPVLHFIMVVEKHAEIRGLDVGHAWWICAYANNQHNLSELASSLTDTPFYRAIDLCQGMLIIMDTDGITFTRVWCCFEQYASFTLGKKLDIGALVADAAPKPIPRVAEGLVKRLREQVENEREADKVIEAGRVIVLTDGLSESEEQLERCYGGQSGYGWQDKVRREDGFPLHLIQQVGLECDIGKGQASHENDRMRILNHIAERDLTLHPLTDKDEAYQKFDKVSMNLRCIFALAAWPQVLKCSDREQRSKLIKGLQRAVRDVLDGQHRQHLEISWYGVRDHVQDADVADLAAALPQRGLETLFLHFEQCMDIGPGLVRLAYRLPNTLRELRLSVRSCKLIDSAMMSAFARSLPRGLERLRLCVSGCPDAGDYGVAKLAQNLPRRLKHLDLDASLTGISDKGLVSLALGLPQDLASVKLDVSGTHVSDAMQKSLSEAVEAAKKKSEEERLAREAEEAAKKTGEEEAAKKAEEERLAREAEEVAKKAKEERKAKGAEEAAKKAEEERKAKEAEEAAKQKGLSEATQKSLSEAAQKSLKDMPDGAMTVAALRECVGDEEEVRITAGTELTMALSLVACGAADFDTMSLDCSEINGGAAPPLCWAIMNHHADSESEAKTSRMAHLLLACRANVNAKNSAGYTPLHLAVEKGLTETALSLINSAANVDEPANNEQTPLHRAAFFGRAEMVFMLLSKSPNVAASLEKRSNTRGDGTLSCLTPLLWAARCGHEAAVRALLNMKANVNAESKHGAPALHLAAAAGADDVVEALLASPTLSAKHVEEARGLVDRDSKVARLIDVWMQRSTERGAFPKVTLEQYMEWSTGTWAYSKGGHVTISYDKEHDKNVVGICHPNAGVLSQRLNGSLVDGEEEDAAKDWIVSEAGEGHGWKYCAFGKFYGQFDDTCGCKGPFGPGEHTCPKGSRKPNKITWVCLDGTYTGVTYTRCEPTVELREEVLNAMVEERTVNKTLVQQLLHMRADPSMSLGSEEEWRSGWRRLTKPEAAEGLRLLESAMNERPPSPLAP